MKLDDILVVVVRLGTASGIARFGVIISSGVSAPDLVGLS
jgi:hypothetical protein